MDAKTRPLYMLSTRDPPQTKGYTQTEIESLGKGISHKWRLKEAGVAILISDKIKAMKRDKEGHYITMKGSIKQEDITMLNIYAPNRGTPQYVRQMLTSMKREVNSNTVTVEAFNIPLTPIDRSTNRKSARKHKR